MYIILHGDEMRKKWEKFFFFLVNQEWCGCHGAGKLLFDDACTQEQQLEGVRALACWEAGSKDLIHSSKQLWAIFTMDLILPVGFTSRSPVAKGSWQNVYPLMQHHFRHCKVVMGVCGMSDMFVACKVWHQPLSFCPCHLNLSTSPGSLDGYLSLLSLFIRERMLGLLQV